MAKMASGLWFGAWFVVLVLITSVSRVEAQQTPRLTPINYGTITLLHCTGPI